MTMTLVTRVRIDPTAPYDNFIFSMDPEDQVAAFINGEIRGMAKLTYVPPPTNQWMAFLTIFGNTSDIGDSVTLEIFDASACLHYPAFFSTGGTFTFVANGTQGTPGAPRILQNYGSLLHEIPVNKGWNWISFNLGFPNPAINEVLNEIPNPAGELVKDQLQFASYNNNTWTGSLNTIGNTSLYMYHATGPKTIKVTGAALTPASVPIPVASGWNWISYIPNYKLSVNAALASLPAVAGDIIKGQTSFAQYVSNAVGWVGDLKSLQAPKGYLIRMANAGTLTYPPQSIIGGDPIVTRNGGSLPMFWDIDASKFEHNMTLIGFFEYAEANATTGGMELGAFVGSELRGAGQAIYVDFLDGYMFFLTCFANKSGEQLHFKLYDAATGEVQELKEHMTFMPNYHYGSIEEPLPFTLQTTGIGELHSELSFNVQPNPFRDETVCLIELINAQEVRLMVADLDGEQLYHTKIQANAGMNRFIWNGRSVTGIPLSNGIYLIRLETEQGILTKKVVIQR
jgi:hypothetical protein